MKKQRPSSMRTFYIGLAVIVVIGVVLISWKAFQPKTDAATILNGPPVSPDKAEGYLYGKPDAPVQIIEFADFECPACANFTTLQEPDVRKRLLDTGEANLRFYDFPLSQHQNSIFAHIAASCAADQGKFWEMHDKLYLGQPDWNGESTSNPKKFFEQYAKELGLDMAKWNQCYEDDPHKERILANRAYGERLNVNQTPTFVIGRQLHPGVLSYDDFKRIVDSLTAAGATASAKAPAATDTTAAGGARPR